MRWLVAGAAALAFLPPFQAIAQPATPGAATPGEPMPGEPAPSAASSDVATPGVATPGVAASDVAAQVAHLMYRDYDWHVHLHIDPTSLDQLVSQPGMPAEWAPLAREALSQETDTGRGELEQAIGRYMARHFSADELAAGLELMNSAAGVYIDQVTAAISGDHPTPTDAAKQALGRTMTTPAGKGFVDHLQAMEKDPEGVNAALQPAFALGFTERLAELMEQSDAYKAVAAGPRTEAEQLAVEAGGILFHDVDFKTGFEKGFDTSGFANLPSRPEWAGLMRAAASDEFDQDDGDVRRILSVHFTPSLTVGELNAGLAVIRGPAGPALAHMIAEAAAGRHVDSPEAERASAKLARTQAGREFMDKFAHTSAVAKGAVPDVVTLVLPRILKRFAAAGWAAEAARTD